MIQRRPRWYHRFTAILILAGTPFALLRIMPPLPAIPTSRDQLTQALTGTLAGLGLPWLITGAAWTLWAILLIIALTGRRRRTRLRRWPRLRLPAPAQTLSAALVGTAAVSAATGLTHLPHTATATANPLPDPRRPVGADPGAAQTVRTVPRSMVVSRSLPLTGPAQSVVADRPPAGASDAAATPAARTTVYEVRRGDWLGGIADRFLGNFDRYPDIQQLNPDLVTNPDLIKPGWRLTLPADAHDQGARRHANGQLVAEPPATNNTAPTNPSQSHPGTVQPSPHGSGGAASPAPPATAGTTVSPSTSGGPTPSATSTPGRTPTSAAATSVLASPTHSTPAPHDGLPAQQPRHGPGVSLPGGWISLPLAAALVAAATTVWRRRRHRYAPTPVRPPADDADLRPLPPVVNRVRRAVREQAPELLHPPTSVTPTVADYHAAGAQHRPDLPPVGASGLDLAGLGDKVPAGGLGLVGPGAQAAARGLLVATLSSGSPADPDAKGQVIIPADALTTLLGAAAAQVGDLPRLQVTASLSEALTRAEELLIERRRLLQDHDATDLPTMRAADPYHPPMPPVLLLCDTPPPQLRARLTTALHLGGPLHISAVLIGDWPRGDTLTVRADGHTGDTPGTRFAVLDVATTLQLLDVLREAHTGQPATAPAHTEPTSPAPTLEPAADTPSGPASTGGEQAGADTTAPTATPTVPTPASDEDEPPAASPAQAVAGNPGRRGTVRIKLLGKATIVDRDGNPVNGLRHHARELLVYLAVHRGGADLSQIMEAFWPAATVRRAGERLSTEAGNLRGRIRQAAGATSDDKGFQPVVNTGSRYHLNPDLLNIDVWRLMDLLRRAAATTGPDTKAALLRQAVDAHTGTLAEGHDYDWIDQPREQLRRHGIRARLDLATLLADSEPATAANLLRAATQLDPINEDLARQAMRALARIGDAAGARTVLQQLRVALDDIDEEPAAETIALAAQLPPDVTGTGPGSGGQARSAAGHAGPTRPST